MAKNSTSSDETKASYEIKSFQSDFGIALQRVLWWQIQEEMGTEILVIAFDNKERLTLRDENQVADAKRYFDSLKPSGSKNAPSVRKSSIHTKMK